MACRLVHPDIHAYLKLGSCFMKGPRPHRNGFDAASSRQKAIAPSPRAARGSFAALTVGALGIVYGDIGTSPLYAMDQFSLAVQTPRRRRPTCWAASRW